MNEKYILYIVCILIICLGVFVFMRPTIVSEKIRIFYSHYPIIKYAGVKQLSSRNAFVKSIGIVLVFLGVICLFSI